MAYNGSSGKRICTGSDLDVERVSCEYNDIFAQHTLRCLYSHGRWPSFVNFRALFYVFPVACLNIFHHSCSGRPYRYTLLITPLGSD